MSEVAISKAMKTTAKVETRMPKRCFFIRRTFGMKLFDQTLRLECLWVGRAHDPYAFDLAVKSDQRFIGVSRL